MKFKMHSLLPSKEEVKATSVPSKPDPKQSLPSFHLSSDKVPEIAGAKVGDHHLLTIHGEVVGTQAGDLYDKSKEGHTEVRYRLHHAAVQPIQPIGEDQTGGKGYATMDEAVKNASKAMNGVG